MHCLNKDKIRLETVTNKKYVYLFLGGEMGEQTLWSLVKRIHEEQMRSEMQFSLEIPKIVCKQEEVVCWDGLLR